VSVRDAMDPRARRTGLVLALGGLLATIDMTVALVAVPAIVADLQSTLPAVQWVTTGYLLGVVAVIPAAGWAANRFGPRRVYVTGLAVFTVASVLAGLAWDATSLTAFRVLQGLGGGLLNPVGQAIGLRSVPPDQRGRLMSLLGLPVLIGPVLGPLLAGWLVDSAGWRWVFLINVPVGAAAIALCLRLVPRHEPDPSTPGIDWIGLTQLSTGAVLTVLGCARSSLPSGSARCCSDRSASARWAEPTRCWTCGCCATPRSRRGWRSWSRSEPATSERSRSCRSSCRA
jgi:EmrB/QacA subfamily drug resistance transporter